MKKTGKRPPRVCPFCNGGSAKPKISGEHIWPDWAAEILPKRPKKREYLHKGWNGFKNITEVRKDYTRPGSPSGVTVPVPCSSCNNGWMSQVENAAKPILEDLVLGSRMHLASSEVEQVALWCFLKFTVLSCLYGEIWCTKPAERTALMQKREIAKPFLVWVFKHDDQRWADETRWHSIRVCTENYPNSMSEPHNVNTLTLGFGKVLFFMAFRWGVDFNPQFGPDRATKLWPQLVPAGVAVPTVQLNAAEIEDIASTLPGVVGR